MGWSEKAMYCCQVAGGEVKYYDIIFIMGLKIYELLFECHLLEMS